MINFSSAMSVGACSRAGGKGPRRWSFFHEKTQYKVGIKLRDAIIDYCIKTDTIDIKLDNRIIIKENE